MFSKSKYLILLVLLSGKLLHGQSSCDSQVRDLSSKLSELIKSEQQIGIGKPLDDFADGSTVKLINSYQQCLQGSGPSFSTLCSSLDNLRVSLSKFPLDSERKSTGSDTEQAYYKFLSSWEAYDRAAQQYQIGLIVDSLESRIKVVVDTSELRLNRNIGRLANIETNIKGHIDTARDDLMDTLTDFRKEMLSIHENYVPLYIGIQLNPENGLGFSGHYHFWQDKKIGMVTAASFLHKVDTASIRHYGGSLGAGLSFGLNKPQNHVALLGEWVGIHKSQFGWRLMAYNRQMAVGIGYSKYMGTGISLLIAFQDFDRSKKKDN